jgi:photosystem II stability/assembly factor-like uncharacterized protein
VPVTLADVCGRTTFTLTRDAMARSFPVGELKARGHRRRLSSLLAGAGVLVAGLSVAVAHAGPVAAAGTVPGWAVAAQPPPLADSGKTGVACVPGGADCAAIGARITCVHKRSCSGRNAAEYSTNGGSTWETASVPAAQGGQFIDAASVSCVNPGSGYTDCAVWAELTRSRGSPQTGLVPYYSTDGGATWAAATPSSSVAENETPIVHCYALRGNAYCVAQLVHFENLYSLDGGANWIAPGFQVFANDISCVVNEGALDCAAVGAAIGPTGVAQDDAFYSTDEGATWTYSSLAPRDGELDTLSCATADRVVHCAAMGSSPGTHNSVVAYSDDGGRSWSYARVPSDPNLDKLDGQFDAVSCAAGGSRTFCAASARYFAPNAGKSSLPTSIVLFSGNGGSSWSLAGDPNGVSGDVACVPAFPGPDCYLVGDNPKGQSSAADYSLNGGATWSASSVDNTFVSGIAPHNLACASPSQCVVVAGDGELYTSVPLHAR